MEQRKTDSDGLHCQRDCANSVLYICDGKQIWTNQYDSCILYILCYVKIYMSCNVGRKMDNVNSIFEISFVIGSIAVIHSVHELYWQHDIIYFTDANTCTETSITHGSVVPAVGPIALDTLLVYTCDTGYHLSTTSYSVICSSDTDNGGNTASLVGTPPTCGKIALMILIL